MKRVDELKEPPVIGKNYLVPCIKRVIKLYTNAYGETIELDELKEYIDECLVINERVVNFFIPIINHPHNDKENGQNNTHYHTDSRFRQRKNKTKPVIDLRPYDDMRPSKTDDEEIIYLELECISNIQHVVTPVGLIKNSKLKHNCIYKGKCPHRGYDLSQEVPVNGVITCPLHGLQFFLPLNGEIINLKENE